MYYIIIGNTVLSRELGVLGGIEVKSVNDVQKASSLIRVAGMRHECKAIFISKNPDYRLLKLPSGVCEKVHYFETKDDLVLAIYDVQNGVLSNGVVCPNVQFNAVEEPNKVEERNVGSTQQYNDISVQSNMHGQGIADSSTENVHRENTVQFNTKVQPVLRQPAPVKTNESKVGFNFDVKSINDMSSSTRTDTRQTSCEAPQVHKSVQPLFNRSQPDGVEARPKNISEMTGSIAVKTVDVKSSFPSIFGSKIVTREDELQDKNDELTDKLHDSVDKIHSLENEISTLTNEQDKQVEQLRRSIASANDEYSKQLATAQNKVIEFSDRLKTPLLSTAELYGSNALAMIDAAFSASDADSFPQSLFVLAAGTQTDSVYIAKQVETLTKMSNGCVIVDLTNDYLVSSVMGVTGKKTSLDFLSGAPVSECSQQMGYSLYFPSGVFNDIALLRVDWVKALACLKSLANGVPIFILLGSICSFAMSYTLTLLSSIAGGLIIAEGSPVNIRTVYGHILFLPATVRLLAYGCIETTHSYLEPIQQNYSVLTLDVKANELSGEDFFNAVAQCFG